MLYINTNVLPVVIHLYKIEKTFISIYVIKATFKKCFFASLVLSAA